MLCGWRLVPIILLVLLPRFCMPADGSFPVQLAEDLPELPLYLPVLSAERLRTPSGRRDSRAGGITFSRILPFDPVGVDLPPAVDCWATAYVRSLTCPLIGGVLGGAFFGRRFWGFWTF